MMSQIMTIIGDNSGGGAQPSGIRFSKPLTYDNCSTSVQFVFHKFIVAEVFSGKPSMTMTVMS